MAPGIGELRKAVTQHDGHAVLRPGLIDGHIDAVGLDHRGFGKGHHHELRSGSTLDSVRRIKSDQSSGVPHHARGQLAVGEGWSSSALALAIWWFVRLFLLLARRGYLCLYRSFLCTKFRDARDEVFGNWVRKLEPDRSAAKLVGFKLVFEGRNETVVSRIERVMLLPAREVEHGRAVQPVGRNLVGDPLLSAWKGVAYDAAQFLQRSPQVRFLPGDIRIDGFEAGFRHYAANLSLARRSRRSGPTFGG